MTTPRSATRPPWPWARWPTGRRCPTWLLSSAHPTWRRRRGRSRPAGAVGLREGAPGPGVVICGRQSDGVWGLPKGTLDEGESLEMAAVREVSEETGLKVEVGKKSGVIENWFTGDGVSYQKGVH